LRYLSFFLICIFIYIPTILNAQSDREGNHCAIQKSPFKISMDSGKVVYSNKCVSCHQSNGLGIEGINPPLNGKLVTGDKTKLIAIIVKGQDSPHATDGKQSQNIMHGNAEIKDQEIAYVLTFIRNSFGNKASLVKVSEVKSARKKL
jgi:mono/diheme cytochrome c family protein